MKNIAIFTRPDDSWALPCWEKTIPMLLDYNIVGTYFFPEKSRTFWYLKTFGIINFIIFALYEIKRILMGASWHDLSKLYKFRLKKAKSPNENKVIEWVKKNNIDIIVIMTNHILKEEIINAPRIGIINKHASILPSCKGLFPFLWCKLTNQPIGVTIHEVTKEIDSGKNLMQIYHPNPDISMLRFYIDVFHLFPQMIRTAIERLINKQYISNSNITSSYFSLPKRKDVKIFSKNYKVARFLDLFYESRWKI